MPAFHDRDDGFLDGRFINAARTDVTMPSSKRACADLLGVEQAIITLEIENQLYNAVSELETVTLTVDKARDLAAALLTVADDLELVRRAHPESVNKPSDYVCERPRMPLWANRP